MIEVDQSHKIERMEKDTILSLSNQHRFVVCIPATVKRQVFDQLRAKGKSRKNAYLWIFSAGVFLLLKAHLPAIIKQREIVVIDTEYTGHDANIKNMVLRHCRKSSLDLSANQIRFAQIGKSSNAHKAAYEVQRGKEEVDKQLTLREFLALM